jgi:hypothetical protein
MADMKREELDRLEREVAQAREQAKHDGLLPDDEKPRFHESGSIHPELDDQTIAPPG